MVLPPRLAPRLALVHFLYEYNNTSLSTVRAADQDPPAALPRAFPRCEDQSAACLGGAATRLKLYCPPSAARAATNRDDHSPATSRGRSSRPNQDRPRIPAFR